MEMKEEKAYDKGKLSPIQNKIHQKTHTYMDDEEDEGLDDKQV